MGKRLYMKGNLLTGAVANALRINCKDKDGNKSTVQAELDKIQNSINEINARLGGLSFDKCTQETYESMETHPETTIYFIKG